MEIRMKNKPSTMISRMNHRKLALKEPLKNMFSNVNINNCERYESKQNDLLKSCVIKE